MKDPRSVSSAVSLLGPASLAFMLGHPATGIAFVIVAVGTWLAHWTRQRWAWELDHVGMFSSLACLAALPWGTGFEWVALAVGGVLAIWYSQILTGVLAAVASLSAVIAGAWVWVVVALALIGAAFFFWSKEPEHEGPWAHSHGGDLNHAVWHVLAASAYAVLVAALG